MRTHTSRAGRGGMRLGARLALAAGPALLAWALIPAATASADTGPTTTLVNSATGDCMDSNYQYGIYDISCNGGNYQNWITTGITTPGGEGAYVIQDAQTGFCLDGNDGGAVYTHDYIAGDTYQEWIPSVQGSTLTFVNAQTGRALQADPGIDAKNPDGTSNQEWAATMVSTIPTNPAMPTIPG